MIKKFDEFVKKSECNDDGWDALDTTFMDFDLNDIPKDELSKQYVIFRFLVVCPPGFGSPLMDVSKNEALQHGADYTWDIDTVRRNIMKQYKLQPWQFRISEECNNIRVGLVIPARRDNADKIIEDMVALGYYVNQRFPQEVEIKFDDERIIATFELIRFDPKFPADMTDEVRKMKTIKHITPKYNGLSIKSNGFIPNHQNERFKYPPRLHFLKDGVDDKRVNSLGKQLCKYNSNPHNDGNYTIYTLDVSKIPDNVKFFGDSCCEEGICTTDKIPYDAVISVENVKYPK